MVTGLSRQVILVENPDPKLFEQAIFILREDAKAVTQEELLKEAGRIVRAPRSHEKRLPLYLYGPAWACGGAMLTGIAWVISSFF